jgi:hypothetical protein
MRALYFYTLTGVMLHVPWEEGGVIFNRLSSDCPRFVEQLAPFKAQEQQAKRDARKHLARMMGVAESRRGRRRGVVLRRMS